MGLFKKEAQPGIDMEQSAANKKRFRELFNDAVPEGDTYNILYGSSSKSQINKGFVVDTRVTTFYYYILGYRESDNRVAVLQIDRDITQHSEPEFISIQEVKETSYYKKLHQIWFIYKDSNRGYGVGLNIGDGSATSLYGIRNVAQEAEREQFLDFFERYTEQLRQMGCKIKKWKR